jgi:hypothetical protein
VKISPTISPRRPALTDDRQVSLPLTVRHAKRSPEQPSTGAHFHEPLPFASMAAVGFFPPDGIIWSRQEGAPFFVSVSSSRGKKDRHQP